MLVSPSLLYQSSSFQSFSGLGFSTARAPNGQISKRLLLILLFRCFADFGFMFMVFLNFLHSFCYHCFKKCVNDWLPVFVFVVSCGPFVVFVFAIHYMNINSAFVFGIVFDLAVAVCCLSSLLLCFVITDTSTNTRTSKTKTTYQIVD